MPNYNCYAYAIGRTSDCQPGDFSNQSYNHSSNIDAVATMIKDDLTGDLGQHRINAKNRIIQWVPNKNCE